MTTDVSFFFSDEGALARYFPDYMERDVQVKMALSVEEALASQQHLIVEAGTGTGKTFAYVVPALLSGKKVLISTGTKNLQDQLFHRDLPQIVKIAGKPVKVALLKGRSNYLCLHRIKLNEGGDALRSIQLQSQLTSIHQWSSQTLSGDTAELTDISEDSPVWPYVTSTADNCLGQDCNFFNDCYLVKARRKAQQADICIINHHLFFADLSLRGTGFGELLPQSDAIIFDEAHQIPEIATQFLGRRMSSRQIQYLIRDVEVAIVEEASDLDFSALHAQLLDIVSALTNALPTERGSWDLIEKLPNIQEIAKKFESLLGEYAAALEPAADRGKMLMNCYDRSKNLSEEFALIMNDQKQKMIRWYERFKASFGLYATPLSVAPNMREVMSADDRAWIFTSATLSVAGHFKHFQDEMGLEEAKTLLLDSPFNYFDQTVLYIPKGLPDPRDPGYTQAQVRAALPIINAVKGRTFMLFTSHRALNEAHQLLSLLINYPLLVQGQKPKTQLLEEFRRRQPAVLLGTSSFWEGVDVRGEDLSCVIIDKLPFTNPDDPVMQARMNAIKERGGSPFEEYQLPQAIIALKQGAGRLIRDQHDRGILMLCDPRLLSKAYGRKFLQSLPNMRILRDIRSSDLQFLELSE